MIPTTRCSWRPDTALRAVVDQLAEVDVGLEGEAGVADDRWHERARLGRRGVEQGDDAHGSDVHPVVEAVRPVRRPDEDDVAVRGLADPLGQAPVRPPLVRTGLDARFSATPRDVQADCLIGAIALSGWNVRLS